MRRHAASSMPRRPVLAQTCLQKDKSIHNSEAPPGNEMTEKQRDSQFLKHGNLCTSQGPGVKPRSPCLHGTSRHTGPTDLQLRIQTHNRAIAHHVNVQHHVSNSPLHMYSSEFQWWLTVFYPRQTDVWYHCHISLIFVIPVGVQKWFCRYNTCRIYVHTKAEHLYIIITCANSFVWLDGDIAASSLFHQSKIYLINRRFDSYSAVIISVQNIEKTREPA